ncbi:UNVERIFIED_ORG: hemolysin D [Burkholderia sp. 1595]|uniref:Membrane fusion protein (MFP) family protein n=1 Tax=Paraburkholderia terricola TaxID=169427 RepID=A0ABU1M1J2_9BURK|nr:hemolysin D [Paraburkholderia terricola]MDR6484750.1 hemolysin D [Paraburkholderia terricola]
MRDLLNRYLSIFRAAWQIRRELDAPAREAQALAFLPAHLELVETPIHPNQHWAMRILVALTIVILLIVVIGKLDIVVSAKGKLVPGVRVKVIQPAITGVVREIAIQDGQRVNAGQLLMKLDTTQAAADADRARTSKIDAALAVARAHALLTAQRDNRTPRVEPVEGATTARLEEAQHLADGSWRAYEDKFNSARAELLKRQAELDTTKEEIAKLVSTAPIARQQADEYKGLIADKYVAKSDYLDKERAALEQEHELAAQQSHARELGAAITEQRADVESVASQFRHDQLDELEKQTQQLTQSRDEQTKADTRQQLLSLTAPVSGTVQQLATHTLGGVVTTAQSLMEIVPDDALEVEATLENKDVGFVDVGQQAEVKIEAFPYTRYGFLAGTVVSLSNDAVQDRKLGLAFTARIRLSANRMWIDKRWISLTPGMSVTAEIRTGKQTVAQYFLGPLVQGAQESMRER